jgi:aldehyde dehydrogenase (NAD+)
LEIVKVLEHFKFEELKGLTLMRKEPIGVCRLITPWNWPMNQIVCKVAPALAAGCAMVLKPSETAPLSGYLFTQILHEAGVPSGVFNLVNGDGPTVSAAISSHLDVAMVSFTGSTRAGVAVVTAAAPSVKRVTQELGGKSANVILNDADLENAVKQGAQECFRNTGQSCNAPTRMLVLCMIPYENEEDAIRIANDTPYGLSGFVTSANRERAGRVAKRIRSGNIHITLTARWVDFGGCFGGYKQSGNGREWCEAVLEEILELKAILGYAPEERLKTKPAT